MKLFTRAIKLAFAVGLVISLVTSTLGIVMAEQMSKLSIVALGDSLAAGRTPYSGHDKSYVDYIAEKADKIGRLQSFDKRYAADGYTTENVLQDILHDKKRGVESGSDTLGIREMLRRADIVTLDAGANDILNALGPNLEADPGKISKTIEEIGRNLLATVTEIKTLNPKVHIYLMGYYNAYPYLPQNQQEKLAQVLEPLNKTIEGVTKQTKSTYVPTAEIIAQDIKTYLPNEKDIHLSAAGYQAIADVFWKEMKSLFSVEGSATSESHLGDNRALPDNTNVQNSQVGDKGTIIDFTDIAGHPAENSIKDAQRIGLVNGYPDGTFRPDNLITSEEMKVMYDRVSKLLPKDSTVTGLVDDKAIGREGNKSMLNGKITRADAIVTLLQMFSEHKKK